MRRRLLRAAELGLEDWLGFNHGEQGESCERGTNEAGPVHSTDGSCLWGQWAEIVHREQPSYRSAKPGGEIHIVWQEIGREA